MIEVKAVKSKKEIRQFIDFPLKLYKNNKYFVPCLYSDELAIFKKDYLYNDQADHQAFIALKDGKVVGRIMAILQKASNEKWKQKRVRFNRFDCIDDEEVSKALLLKVEQYAKERGMNEVVGPLGFSDLEREGLLIEGFDYLSTFEEQYNYPYYQRLIESCGYEKEIDWVERRLFKTKEDTRNIGPRLEKISQIVMKKNKLHFAEAKNINEFLKKYKDDFFDLCEKTYENLYMTVPFSEKIKKSLISSFKLIINKKYVSLILNEKNEPVCFGLCFPEMGRFIQKSNGKLTPITLIKLLRGIRHPKVLDLGLIGVDPRYVNSGIASVLINFTYKYLNEDPNIEYLETNLNLENNYHIISLWSNFENIQHKRRRSFIKKI
ncbi:MAG: hypothetical protein ACI31G_02790 [Bacilli bacterium]